MAIKEITPTEFFRLHQESGALHLVDVRESDEFAAVSSPLATNSPLSTLNSENISKKHSIKEPLYLICRSGARSLKAAQILENHGFELVYNLKGGMNEWEASGLPVVRK